MEFEPIDITQIIVAIISLFGTIYSVLKGQREHERLQGAIENQQTDLQKDILRESRRVKWILCIFVILLMLNLAVFGYRYLSPEVEIVYPCEGADVETCEMIEGISCRIPEEHVIWIVIRPHAANHYYPQDGPADVEINGDWSSSSTIGIDGDAGKKFDIIAVLADGTAQDEFNRYLDWCREMNSWPGLERLPEGVSICDRITVMRKKLTVVTDVRVSVPANQYWYNTGIKVKKGDKLEITAEGTWWNGTDETGPDGYHGSCGQCPVVDGNLGELIGRIGNGMPFRIGSFAEIIVTEDGILWLAMNENTGSCEDGKEGSCYKDNNGLLQVEVVVWCIQ